MRRSLCGMIVLLGLVRPASAGNGGTGTVTGQVSMGGSHRPVANAVVYVVDGRTPLEPHLAPVVLEQTATALAPRVQLARAGGVLVLQNSVPELHVLRLESLQGGRPPAVLLRVAMPYAGYEKRWPLPAPGAPYLLRAQGENGGERRTAYLAVMPHRWAAVTDDQGRYRLEQVPGGEHRLCAWHETLGALAGRVRVARGRTREMQFDFPRAP